MIGTLFYHPMTLSFYSQLWMLLPLCLAVSIIYKTIRTTNIYRLWMEITYLFFYILGGLAVLAVILWLILAYWP